MSDLIQMKTENWVMVRLTKAGRERRDRLTSEKRCTGCEQKHQPEKQVRCGLCVPCYEAARRAIKANKITAEELIRDGKMLEPQRGGRKPSNDFSRELSEL